MRGIGISLPAAAHIPSSRIAALARFANTAKVSAINRLPAARRMATLVAFALCLEATAHDDALEVLEALLRDLFSNAEKTDKKARMRSLKDLDRSAATLAAACKVVLDSSISDDAARPIICRSLGLTIDAGTTLEALSAELDATWQAVAARLPDNPAIQLSENAEGKTELSLGALDSWRNRTRCCNCGRPWPT